MLAVIILLVSLCTVAIVGTIRALRIDGYRRLPTDHTRRP